MNYLIVGIISLVVAAGGLFASKELNKVPEPVVVATTTVQARTTTTAVVPKATTTVKTTVEAPKPGSVITATAVATASVTVPAQVDQPKVVYASGVNPLATSTAAADKLVLTANIDAKQQQIDKLKIEISILIPTKFITSTFKDGVLTQSFAFSPKIYADIAKILSLSEEIKQLQTTGTSDDIVPIETAPASLQLDSVNTITCLPQNNSYCVVLTKTVSQ